MIGRVNFDSAHIPRRNAVKFLLPVRILRVDAGKGEHICNKGVLVVRGSSVIDVMNLLWLRCNRKND